MKRPIFILLISYILGILIHEYILFNLNLFIIILVLLLIFYSIKIKNATIILIFFVFAIININSRYPYLKEDKKYESNIEIIYKKQRSFNYQYFVKDLKNNLKFIIYTDKNFNLGDVLNIEGKLNEVKTKNNFRTFNYRKYLKTKNVHYELKLKKYKYISNSNKLKYKIIDKIRNNYLNNLNNKSSKLLLSMILGISDDNEEIFENFKDLGLAHVLAISGLHLNILILILEKIGKYARVSKKIYGIFIILILLLYGYIIDFPVSLIRAIFMYSFTLLSIYTLNIKDNMNLFYLSMLFILIINPFFIYSIGFYLSFASIFGIYYINEKLNLLFPNANKEFILSISIQLSILPIIFYSFNKISLMSIFTNFLLLPLISFGLFLGFLYTLIPINIFAILIDGVFYIIELMTDALNLVNDYFIFNFRSFSIKEIILYYLLLISLLNYNKILYFIKRRNYKILTVIIIIIIFLKNLLIQNVYINFIDVGQGDSVLIRDGNINILYDTGGEFLSFENSSKNYYDYLYKNGISKIDYLFISHNDFDHYGNLTFIKDKIKIDNLYANNLKGFISKRLKVNDDFNFKNVKARVIFKNEFAENENEKSAVIKLNIFDKTLLLTGDIENGENNIKIGKIDFLKVAHHGAKNATKEIFLNNNQIKNAFISAGLDNKYKHPSKEVLERLKNHKINIFRTDKDGNIELIINKYGYMIRAYNRKMDIFNFIKLIIIY